MQLRFSWGNLFIINFEIIIIIKKRKNHQSFMLHRVHPVANMKTVDFLSSFCLLGVVCASVSRKTLCNTEATVTRVHHLYRSKMLSWVKFCMFAVQWSTLSQCWPAKNHIHLLRKIDSRNMSHYSHYTHKQHYSFMKC